LPHFHSPSLTFTYLHLNFAHPSSITNIEPCQAFLELSSRLVEKPNHPPSPKTLATIPYQKPLLEIQAVHREP